MQRITYIVWRMRRRAQEGNCQTTTKAFMHKFIYRRKRNTNFDLYANSSLKRKFIDLIYLFGYHRLLGDICDERNAITDRMIRVLIDEWVNLKCYGRWTADYNVFSRKRRERSHGFVQ